MYKKYTFIYLILLLCSTQTWGQASISGIVADREGAPLTGANVVLKNSPLGAVIDDKGHFTILNAPVGAVLLEVQFLGYVSKEISFEIKQDQALFLEIEMYVANEELDEIVIKGKSKFGQRKEAPVKAVVIDTKSFKEQSTTVVELINRTPGIRVRQSGGMGSFTQINLNGFQGNSIRMFKDGVPLDYLGIGYSIGLVPTNSLEGIEVYKGVLPSHLGADALGGALNLVSVSNKYNRISISYEIASFNTHRVTVNASINSKNNKVYGGVESFINYSDNNYDVDVNYVDSETSNEIPITTKLFHNRYKQYYVELFMGFKNLKWVDDLKLSVTNYKIYREDQFGQLMQYPIGAAFSTLTANAIPTLRYKKRFLNNKLKFDQFIACSKITRRAVDTLNGQYDWQGYFTANNHTQSPGEIGGTANLITLDMYNTTSRTLVNYTLNEKHKITSNTVYYKYSQQGTDPYGFKTEGDNAVYLISLPAIYNKLVIGMALDSEVWENKIKNSFQIKYYNSNSRGLSYNINTGQIDDDEQSASLSNFGIANSIRYELSNKIILRLSVEQATRLPTQREVFGNGDNILANFSLNPEQSTNVNLEFNYKNENQFMVDMNVFYRNTKNMILTSFTELVFYGTSENLNKVQGYGLEFQTNYTFLKKYNLKANMTYQSFRQKGIQEGETELLNDSRINNMPYFFSNLGIDARFTKIILKKDALRAYWNYSYVHPYFLKRIPKKLEPDGFLQLWGAPKLNTTLYIEKQNMHSAGFVWTPNITKQFSIGFDVKNIFNQKVYDDFKIQNAGRSFHCKLTTSINFLNN